MSGVLKMKMRKNFLGFMRWFGLLVAVGLTLAGRRLVVKSYQGLWQLGSWMFSSRGLALASGLAIMTIIAGFVMIDRVRLGGESALLVLAPQADSAMMAGPDPILARVDGRPLRLSSVAELASQEGKRVDEVLTPNQAFERGLVDLAINQMVVTKAAKKDKLPEDPRVRTKLQTAEYRILYGEYFQNIFDQAATETNAKALYEAQRKNLSFGDEIRLRRLLVPDQDSALALYALLQQGAVPFEQLARERSIDPQYAVAGGDMGYLAYDQMPEAYADIAFALARGQVSEPFEGKENWVMVQPIGRRKAQMPSYRETKNDILRFLGERAVADKLATLKEESDVVIFMPPSQPLEQPQADGVVEKETKLPASVPK